MGFQLRCGAEACAANRRGSYTPRCPNASGLRRYSGEAVELRRGDNGREVIRQAAGAADKAAIHVLDGKDFLGIGGFQRSAVEDTEPLPAFAEARNQLVAQGLM